MKKVKGIKEAARAVNDAEAQAKNASVNVGSDDKDDPESKDMLGEGEDQDVIF